MPPSHTKLLYYVLVCIGIVNITTLWLPAEQNSKRAQPVTRSVLPRVPWQSPATQQRNPFMQVHVLTMTRAQSLQRLLQSLQDARYDGALVNLTIHVDHHANNRACIQVAEDFQFAHGSKQILISDTAHGLRDAWFDAWHPNVEYIERAIILEDDIMLSPLWYVWLSAAWDAYQGRDDLAGISLQRQAFVHKIGAENFEIVNNHVPFLYASVGSIGFSPHWRQWRNFLAWVKSVDVSTVDVHVPGLTTSQWFAHQDRRKMWTQYFIWFCEQKQLMTLFVNIPGARALASHMREAGVHHGKGLAPDFPVATATTSSNWEFPPRPFQYGWDAKLLHDSVCTNIAQSLPWESTAIPTCNQHVLEQALQIQRQHEFVNIQFLNQGFINMTKSWLCNIRQFPGVEERTLFITTDPESFYAISSFTQQARVVLLPYATDTTLRYGQHAYFEYMMFRSNIILFLLQQNVTIWLTEADAVWFRDPTTAVSSSTADYVTMNDETPPKKMVQGGFQFLRPSTATISIWSRMIPVLQNKLNLNFLFALFDWSTEQAMLSDLLKATGQPKVEWLNAHRFVSGIYYKNAKNYKDPIVVLNNWIRGIDAKTERAKRWGHWFLGEDGTCLHTRSRDQSSQPLQRQLVTDGTAYGGWTYDQSQLHAASVVYSVGLGEDTSWDETLIRRFHLQVWGFDPTPKSAAYVRSRRQLPLEHFHFTAEGLSVRSGNLTFTKPANSNHVSMREGEHAGAGEKIQVPVNTLQNWMKKFGHARIDLLKLDIEGSEYDVLQDWIDSAWFPMSQLLVEFHFHEPKDHLRHLVIFKALKRHGFDVMYEKTEKETKMGFVRTRTPA